MAALPEGSRSNRRKLMYLIVCLRPRAAARTIRKTPAMGRGESVDRVMNVMVVDISFSMLQQVNTGPMAIVNWQGKREKGIAIERVH